MRFAEVDRWDLVPIPSLLALIVFSTLISRSALGASWEMVGIWDEGTWQRGAQYERGSPTEVPREPELVIESSGRPVVWHLKWSRGLVGDLIYYELKDGSWIPKEGKQPNPMLAQTPELVPNDGQAPWYDWIQWSVSMDDWETEHDVDLFEAAWQRFLEARKKGSNESTSEDLKLEFGESYGAMLEAYHQRGKVEWFATRSWYVGIESYNDDDIHDGTRLGSEEFLQSVMLLEDPIIMQALQAKPWREIEGRRVLMLEPLFTRKQPCSEDLLCISETENGLIFQLALDLLLFDEQTVEFDRLTMPFDHQPSVSCDGKSVWALGREGDKYALKVLALPHKQGQKPPSSGIK